MASFEKIDYLLRPSKQIERKLIIETLLKLSKIDYHIPEYTYIGLGSIFYVDFILFHKYLYIDKMICSEKANIPKRMDLNKPYKFIQLEMKPIGDIIPNISRDQPHVVWLDYDSYLGTEEIKDINGFMTVLPARSIFIVTIQADPNNLINLIDPLIAKTLNDEEKRNREIYLLRSMIGNYTSKKTDLNNLTRKNLARIYSEVIVNLINSQMDKRKEMKFFQLFNFCYADGVQMLTIGGIIDSKTNEEIIENSKVYDLDFVTKSLDSIRISVPPLTMIEKKKIEKLLIHGGERDLLDLEIDKKLLDNFLKFYKHYPSYTENII